MQVQHQQQQNGTGTGSPPPLISTQTVEPQPKKVKQVGKILPEIKKPENHGAQFGPVGAKPPMKPAWHEDVVQPNHQPGSAYMGGSQQGGPEPEVS